MQSLLPAVWDVATARRVGVLLVEQHVTAAREVSPVTQRWFMSLISVGAVDSWLPHALTQNEGSRFERDGYLIIRDALDAALVERLIALSQREDATFRATPDIGPHHVLNLHGLVGRDATFLELVDFPTTFPKVFGALGWNIQLFHTQLIVTPPAPPGATAGSYGWHQDNNRMNLDFETSPPHPRVSMKVGYFLTDLTGSSLGNLCVVPGSHRLGRPPSPYDGQPEGALEVTAQAGDAIVFDRRLWHAASTNVSSHTRVFMTYGYSYRWLRPKSEVQMSELYPGCDPVRRQLLGASPSGSNGYFDPQPEDVPLRAWMEAHSTTSEARR